MHCDIPCCSAFTLNSWSTSECGEILAYRLQSKVYGNPAGLAFACSPLQPPEAPRPPRLYLLLPITTFLSVPLTFLAPLCSSSISHSTPAGTHSWPPAPFLLLLSSMPPPIIALMLIPGICLCLWILTKLSVPWEQGLCLYSSVSPAPAKCLSKVKTP